MSTSVTYSATLDVRRETGLFLSALLHAEPRRRGTRCGRRALGCFAQAVLILRWFTDGTGSGNWPPTITSAARPPTATCMRASTSSPPTHPT